MTKLLQVMVLYCMCCTVQYSTVLYIYSKVQYSSPGVIVLYSTIIHILYNTVIRGFVKTNLHSINNFTVLLLQNKLQT